MTEASADVVATTGAELFHLKRAIANLLAVSSHAAPFAQMGALPEGADESSCGKITFDLRRPVCADNDLGLPSRDSVFPGELGGIIGICPAWPGLRATHVILPRF